jgi:hypothetical protein
MVCGLTLKRQSVSDGSIRFDLILHLIPNLELKAFSTQLHEKPRLRFLKIACIDLGGGGSMALPLSVSVHCKRGRDWT